MIMTGPTIRLWWDDGKFWESTPAFDANKILSLHPLHPIPRQDDGNHVSANGTKRHVVDAKIAAGYLRTAWVST